MPLGTILWCIWKDRNKKVISNLPFSISDTANNIIVLRQDLNTAFGHHHKANIPVPRLVCWSKPPSGVIKLNTDGSCLGNTGPAGMGGLFRNNQGGWIMGYACKMGHAYSLEAKLCSMRMGLWIAWDQGITSLNVESDCEVTVNLILRGDHQFHRQGPIIMGCRELISRHWNCSVPISYAKEILVQTMWPTGVIPMMDL
ncbi:hypothetical protein L1049_001683 [Liquidambar formosana]|uniref:RNase H type-1 domain-containing protein n=1 Tax=Liquidambar formosana TaxID=63359 RepID=A0AAP0N3N0_LIQFO